MGISHNNRFYYQEHNGRINNMNKLLLITILTIPNITFAISSFSDLVEKFVGLINVIIPILISLAIVIFFYNTGKGIFGNAKSSGEAQTQLKETLLWGVLIIFVMVSIWGILNLIGGEFNLMQQSFTK